ncbi:MAG: hypothetical protein JST89_24760 [Cyanobacteria bacterium SZAS-4]|nr:hypothetical protein [Cyanobacteria bacterium SZAS-4]
MPFVVFTLLVSMAFLGLAVDVMRTIHAASAIQYASQASALYSYQYAFNPNGTLKSGRFENNVLQELQVAGGSNGVAWNQAPSGPNGPTTQSPVEFDASDVSVVQNANDAGDYFLQVRARRDGTNGLTMYFLPAIFALNSILGLPSPPNLRQANPFRTTEVIVQPATRIGAGLSRNMSPIQADSRQIGVATFPLAISNKQFAIASQPGQPLSSYTIDLVSSKAPGVAAADHIQGAFVNVYGTGGLQYYGAGQGDVALNQLYGTLSYFSNANAANALPPAVVERGSKVSAFDPSDPIYQQQAQTLLTPRLKTVPIGSAAFYILPVISDNPSFGGAVNKVVGFARMALTEVRVDGNGVVNSFRCTIGESYPMANASIGTALASVPSVSGTPIPALQAGEQEFAPRSFDGASNSIAARPRGVVMAPALSPRSIVGGPL